MGLNVLQYYLKKFLYLGVECVQIIKQYHNLLRLVLFVRSLVLLCFITKSVFVETLTDKA